MAGAGNLESPGVPNGHAVFGLAASRAHVLVLGPGSFTLWYMAYARARLGERWARSDALVTPRSGGLWSLPEKAEGEASRAGFVLQILRGLYRHKPEKTRPVSCKNTALLLYGGLARRGGRPHEYIPLLTHGGTGSKHGVCFAGLQGVFLSQPTNYGDSHTGSSENAMAGFENRERGW